MRNIIQRVNKAAVMYGLIGVACAVVVGMIGWPYLLSHYGMIAAIVFLGIIIVFSAIAAYGFAAHTHIGVRRGHIDLRAYERNQLSLPLSSLPTTKVSEEDAISASVLQKRLPRSRHVLHPAKVSPATPQSAHLQRLQKPFATGYRPPSTAIANPQPANLQAANLQPIDDIDAKILQAKEELQSRGLKPTDTAIAKMTGIAERTVYDRTEKMRQR